MSLLMMRELPLLVGYPESIHLQVQRLIDNGRLGDWLEQRYGQHAPHGISSDKALYDYAMTLKNRYLGNTAPLMRVRYDSKLNVIRQTLGLNSHIARVQGSKLKTRAEIQIASLFRDAPAPFLRMIMVHELAHLRERQHDKAFYQLCCHMEPDYHQLELDLRLYLTWQALESRGKG